MDRHGCQSTLRQGSPRQHPVSRLQVRSDWARAGIFAGLLAGTLVSSACVSSGKYLSTRQDLETATQEARLVFQELETLKQAQVGHQARVEELEAELNRTRGTVAAQKAQLEGLGDDPALARQALALQARQQEAQRTLVPVAQALEQALATSLSTGQIKLELERGRIHLSAAESHCFDVGKSELKPECKSALGEAARVMAGTEGIELEARVGVSAPGKTKGDDVWSFSSTRAVQVVRALAGAGLPAGMLRAVGTGQAGEAGAGLEIVASSVSGHTSAP